MLVGVRTGKDLIRHPLLIIREYGWRVFIRALIMSVSWRRHTFTELMVIKRGGRCPAPSPALDPPIRCRCVPVLPPQHDWILRVPVGGAHCDQCISKIYGSKAYLNHAGHWMCLACAPAWFKRHGIRWP